MNQFFDNLNNENKKEDEKKTNVLNTLTSIISNVSECELGDFVRFLILLKHDYFNEVEAATFLRLPDPKGNGKVTVRNYALRSKKLSFYKIGRAGLTFSRKDLENFLETQKVRSFQESHY